MSRAPRLGAQLGRQDPGMADRAALRGQLGQVVAPQAMPPDRPHELAFPNLAELRGRQLAQLLDRGDSPGRQPLFHPRADAGKIAQRQRVQPRGQFRPLDHCQAVRFLHIGRDFGEHPVRREADRAAQRRSRVAANRRLDSPGQAGGGLRRAVEAGEAAHQLVDREHRQHRQARIHRLHDAVVHPDVFLRAGLDQAEVRAQAAGLGDDRPRFDAVPLGLVAGCDAAGGFRPHRHDSHGATPQLRPQFLLDRREVRVHIHIQVFQAHIAASRRC